MNGLNTEITHGGRRFHVQTEAGDSADEVFDTSVYVDGWVLASRRIRIADLAGKHRTTEPDILLQRLHYTAIAAIRAGRLDRKIAELDRRRDLEGNGPRLDPAAPVAELPIDFQTLTVEELEAVPVEEAFSTFLASAPDEEHLILILDKPESLESDASAPFRLEVLGSHDRRPIAGASVTIKLKTRRDGSRVVTCQTDSRGRLGLFLRIPDRSDAPASLTITARAEGLGRAEIRQQIYPS